jgi:hypothetical protein
VSRRGALWTVDELVSLAELHYEGRTDPAVAAMLGRSAAAICAARRRHGIQRSVPKAVAIRARELDERDVALIMAGDPVSIRMGLVIVPEAVEAVRRLAAAGLSDRQIRDRIHGFRHLSRHAVCKLRERCGIPAHVAA